MRMSLWLPLAVALTLQPAAAQPPVCRTGDAAKDAQAKLVMDAIFAQPGDRYRPYRFAGPVDPVSYIERTRFTRRDSRPIDPRWPYFVYYQYPDQLSFGPDNFYVYVGTDASVARTLVRGEEQWGFYERTIGRDADGADIAVAPLTYVPQDRARYVPMIEQAEAIRARSPLLKGTEMVTDAISLQCLVAAYYRGDDLVSVVTILNPWWAKRPTEKGTYPNVGVHLRLCDRRAHALIYGFKNLDLSFFWKAAEANGATAEVRANTLPDLPDGWEATFAKMRGLRMIKGSSPAVVCTQVRALLDAND